MAQLLQLDTICADGYHNAFTDLLRWRDAYYCSFRQAQAHGIETPGDALVYRSSDLSAWELCARFDTGADDRDPKLIDAGDRLGVVFGSWFPRWGAGGRSVRNAAHDLISHVALSRDGRCWSTPQQVYGVNYWLWRVLPTPDGFYCAAYHFARRDDRQMRTVHLLRSEDLLDWRLVTAMRAGGGAGEPALFVPAPGELACVIRSLEPHHHAWLGHSRSPYVDWSWTDLGVMIHAPAILQHQGTWLVAGRSQACDLPPAVAADVERGAPAGHHTSVWRLEAGRAAHVLTLPSAGDCSYPGLAPGPAGEVLMTYYSQHERLPLPAGAPTPADVFLARIQV